MSPSMLTVYEPGDTFLTTDSAGHVREFMVKKDGLVMIISGARFEAERPEPELEQQGRDRAAEQ